MQILTLHYKKNFSTLVKKLAKKMGSEQEAEDTVQDAYERAIKYASSFDATRGDFNVWFGRILTNAIKDNLSIQRGRREVEYEDEHDEGIPCEHYTEKVIQEIAHKISRRKPYIAEILSLFFLRGYSAKEIAQIVESNSSAVHVVIYRFREELKNEYRTEGSIYA